jgi:hypothetical protein
MVAKSDEFRHTFFQYVQSAVFRPESKLCG